MNALKTVLAVLASLYLAIAAPTFAQESAPEPLSAFPQSLLSIRTKSGQVINFKIWTADNPRREQQGLMFIRSMDPHNGMLFMFPENRPVTMWMKNTYIPLDLVFTDSKGRIDYIEKNATPVVHRHHRTSDAGIRCSGIERR